MVGHRFVVAIASALSVLALLPGCASRRKSASPPKNATPPAAASGAPTARPPAWEDGETERRRQELNQFDAATHRTR